MVNDKRIRVPTLFILGEQDFAILPRTVRGVGDYIAAPYTELRIPDWATGCKRGRGEVNTALMSFLSA